jgi:hypothetical protein
MKSSDTVHLRIAQVLRVSFYSALSLMILSVVMKSLEIKAALIVATAGIGLIILGPMFGVIAAAIIALSLKNLRFFFAAIIILAIFIIAFLVGL